jgi:hypothetical protein
MLVTWRNRLQLDGQVGALFDGVLGIQLRRRMPPRRRAAVDPPGRACQVVDVYVQRLVSVIESFAYKQPGICRGEAYGSPH